MGLTLPAVLSLLSTLAMGMGGVCLMVCLIHARAVSWESLITAGVGLPSPDLFLPLVRDEAHHTVPQSREMTKGPVAFSWRFSLSFPRFGGKAQGIGAS